MPSEKDWLHFEKRMTFEEKGFGFDETNIKLSVEMVQSLSLGFPSLCSLIGLLLFQLLICQNPNHEESGFTGPKMQLGESDCQGLPVYPPQGMEEMLSLPTLFSYPKFLKTPRTMTQEQHTWEIRK